MQDSLLVAPVRGHSAPALVNHRKKRYQGDDLCLPVTAFSEPDQTRLLEIYHLLESLFAVLRQRSLAEAAENLAAAKAFIAAQKMDEWLNCVRSLGVGCPPARTSELMAKTIHDLRGGAMSALLGQLQLAQIHPPSDQEIRQLFFLTRDHLKIMRNALLGLDDRKRHLDLTPKMHGVDLIIEKWQHALLSNVEADRQILMEVSSDFHGNIAECCVEFGALDRVLYNLVNNSCRHTASGDVKLAIQSQPEGVVHPDNLCFRVSNPISQTDAERLRRLGDLNQLFQPGASSTGSGFGLTVALDFVANAYGLGRRQLALAGHYLGAELDRQEFSVWFYWPVAADV